MIWFFIILIFALVIAATWWFGMWSNFITLINLVLAGLIASSFYENVAGKLLDSMATFAALLEFIAVWAMFVLAFIILRGATDALSPIRLKFDNLTELIGRSVLSVAIAIVFICFAMFTLQMAPLPPHVLIANDSSFKSAGTRLSGTDEQIQAKLAEETESIEKMLTENKYEEAIGPDTIWTGTFRLLSRGSLSTTRDEGLFYGADERKFEVDGTKYDFNGVREFDPMETFYVESAIKRRAVSRQTVLRIDTSAKQ